MSEMRQKIKILVETNEDKVVLTVELNKATFNERIEPVLNTVLQLINNSINPGTAKPETPPVPPIPVTH